jgi:hypothetical protein
LGFLFEKTNRIAEVRHNFALVFLIDAGDNSEERRLPRSVETEDTDLGAVEEREINVFENLF